MRITDATIRSLRAPENGAKIYVCDQLDGFGIRVSQAGTKAFVLTYGKRRERITIGRYPVISLQDARAEAKRILAERTLGKHRPARLRASEALLRFIREQREKNRPVTVRYTEALIRNHFPKLLDKNLEDVRTDDVTDVTDKLLKKRQPGAANHAFAAIRTFLRWCVRRRYIHHSPVEGIEPPAKAGSRERVLSDDELRAVWQAADATEGHFSAIVKLLILCGQRRSEIANLRAEWLDLDKTTCTIPANHTKNKRSHTFPVGSLSLSVLQGGLHSADWLVFSARGSCGTKPFNGWSKAKAALDKKVAELQVSISKPIAPWTLHDLRRTYATNLQRLGVEPVVIDALLNHISGQSSLTRTYQRHHYWDEMVEAVAKFEDWFRRMMNRE
jgi:integrase